MNIDSLPTILDVVERISSIENQLILPSAAQIPSSPFFDEGRFNYVSERKNRDIVKLMPTSQSPFHFFRGQSKYYEPCVPSLYRRNKKGAFPTDEEIAANRIKYCEFALLLNTHPVFREVGRNLLVDPVALAQHYGLTTDYLDITNSKWVAAFFACTGYDNDSDTYYPAGRNYGDGYGVMYISKDYDGGGLTDVFFDKNGVIGYQYFARPSKQSSFGFKMAPGEDFNTSPYFDKVYFRHDLKASTIVFEMSYRQNRFIPKDSLSKLARKLVAYGEVTRASLNLCWKTYYSDRDAGYLDDVCVSKGWKIREGSSPIVEFSRDELENDWREWNRYGREDLRSRILPIIPVTSFQLPTYSGACSVTSPLKSEQMIPGQTGDDSINNESCITSTLTKSSPPSSRR